MIPNRAALALTKGGTNHRLADRIVAAATGGMHEFRGMPRSCLAAACIGYNQVVDRTHGAAFNAGGGMVLDVLRSADLESVRGVLDAR